MLNTRTIALFLILMLLNRCTKEVDQFIPDTIAFDFETEFESQNPEESFLLDGTDYATFYTASGTQFEVDFGIFEYADGTPCPCDEIEMRVREFKKPSDFILAEMKTGSDDLLLGVETMFEVKATSAGKELRPRSGFKLHFHEPAPDDSSLDLYYGLGESWALEWKRVEDLPAYFGHIEYVEWDDGSFKGYEGYLDKLGWVSVARNQSSGKELTSVCVDLDLLTYDKNARVFAVGKDDLIVKPFYYDIEKECFCAWGLPIGLDISLVVIRKADEGIYNFVQQNATVSTDLEVHMEYAPGTLSTEEILQRILAVD
ncbi:MAG: hypothetical protein KTR24_07580 [Saprospiraceae bacterium]|nr:hypothetical protein [Saprospiraceae bacterium]